MKNIVQKGVLSAVLFALVGFTVPASAQPKIGVVEMRKVFDGFYKTKQADAALKEEGNDLEKERADMVDNYRKRDEERNKLIEKANDQSLSPEERDRSKVAADRKLLELKDLEKTVDEFDRAARTKQMEKKRLRWDAIVGEIRAAINAKAKAEGYTMILDTAGESLNNTPVVLYTNGSNDLTEAILATLNAAAPASATKTDTKPVDAKPAAAKP